MKKSGNKRSPRFLVVSTTGIGDTLMGTPALRALRESFPDGEIHVLVNVKKKDLLRHNPHIDRLLEYRNNWLYRGLLFLKTLGTFYDTVLVFHANDDIWKILRMIHYHECLNRQNYADPARRVVPLASLPRHSIQKRLALVEKAGGNPAADYRYEYSVPRRDVRWAAAQLARWGVSPKDRLVGMQLGAADAFKCWPVESFVELARLLRNRLGARIYLNASPKETPLRQRFEKQWVTEGLFYAPRVRLPQSAALIQSCSLFISADTGPMHMAIGLGVPLIALFCPTPVEDTGPLDYDRGVVIQKPETCTPCITRKCTENFCMGQISVEEVYAAAEEILKKADPGGQGRAA
jgi:ADP-heptose:LPS heptosyltransferase